MKRLICPVLIAYFLLFAFVGCADSSEPSDKTKTTTATTTAVTDKPFADDLPSDLKFGNNTVRFALAEAQNGKFSERSLGIEDYQGDIVDSAVHSRNLAINERLGLEIEIVAITEYKKFSETVSPALQSGDDAYDILMGYQYFDITLASKGYLYDMNTADDVDYIDVEKEYWSTDYINALNYGNRLYWVTGDISLRYTSGIYCTFVNEELYQSALFGNQGSIFDIVRQGNWDFATMSAMCETVYTDSNSNNICDEGDIIGLTVEKGNSSTKTALAVGAGVKWSEKDANGQIKLLFNSENTRLINAIQSLDTVYNDNAFVYTPVNSDDDNAMKLFASGGTLFTMSKLYNAETYLRSFSDFYVIPMPKFDRTDTDGYKTLLHDGVNLFGIAHTSSRKAESKALLEAMSSMGYKTVVPAYYDAALKAKYTNDPDSSDMIDEIRRGIYIDFVLAWDNQITANWLRGSITSNPSSGLTRFQESWETKFEELLKVFE